MGRGLLWQASKGLRVQSDAPGARACFERALAIAERAQGPDGLLVGEALANLAGALAVLGEPASAQTCAERALAIAQRVNGPDHPSVARGHRTLAIVLASRGDFAGQKTQLEARARD